jgi:hypothetical protein
VPCRQAEVFSLPAQQSSRAGSGRSKLSGRSCLPAPVYRTHNSPSRHAGFGVGGHSPFIAPLLWPGKQRLNRPPMFVRQLLVLLLHDRRSTTHLLQAQVPDVRPSLFFKHAL